MDLVEELTRERGMSTILITHDLGLAAAYCDRIVVMERGRVVEKPPPRPRSSGSRRTPIPRSWCGRRRDRASTLRDLLPEGTRPQGQSARTAAAGGSESAAAGQVDKLVKEFPRKGGRARRPG